MSKVNGANSNLVFFRRVIVLRWLSVLLAAWAFTSSLAEAAWSNNPAINNAISTAEGYQDWQHIVSDGNGGAIIVWHDTRSGSNDTDIYGQRINANGDALWAANGVVISQAANYQVFPSMISDGNGGAIIAWIDFRNGPTTFNDIYAQRIDANGAAQWTANGVAIASLSGDQQTPVLVSDGNGGAIITWIDYRNGPAPDIYAQRVNAEGAAQWVANGVAISTAVDFQYCPVIVSDGNGGAIIAWNDHRSRYSDINFIGNFDIYAQRIDAGGAVQWAADGVAISTAPRGYRGQMFPWPPAMISDGNGGAIIAWNDKRNGNEDIYAQKIDAGGNAQWPANGVAISKAAADQQHPSIIGDGLGGVIITWEDSRNGNSDIYAQKINSGGEGQWTPDGAAVSMALGNKFNPSIIGDGLGGVIITWEDSRNGNSDIYAQKINSGGAAQWTPDGALICSATGDQQYPFLVGNNSGGAIIAWNDGRSGNSDIYAQMINSEGILGVEEVTLKWRYTTGNYIYSSPAIGADGTVYVGEGDNSVYALNPDGTLKWSYATGAEVYSSPATAADGTLYVGSADHSVYALNPNGILKWKYVTGDFIESSPAIGADGTVYVGSADHNVYALNPNGTLKWSYATAWWVISSPAIGVDGTVYVGSMDNNVYALNPDGTLKWSYAAGYFVQSSPAIGVDGTVYVGSFDHNIYALKPDGTLKWNYTTRDVVISSPAIGTEGTVYVGSFDGNLYAVNGSGPLANSPWPMFHHDLQHKGRGFGVTINGGATYAIKTSVTLTLSAAADVTRMCISNTATCTSWTAFSATKTWTLATGNGTKTVHVRFRDALGNTTPDYTDTIILDATVPVNGTLTAIPGPGQIILNWSKFNDAASGIRGYKVVYATGTAPISCATGTQAPGYDGSSATYTHTGLVNQTYGYRVCAIDNAGNMSSGAAKTAKPLPKETDPPTGGSIVINKDDAWTKSASVTLALSALDESLPMQMCVSNTSTCSSWTAFADTKTWTLATGNGTKTVYVKFRDMWGNTTPAYTDTIGLDTTAPANVTVTATPGLGQITLNWSAAADAMSGTAGYKVVFGIGSAPGSCSAGSQPSDYDGTSTTYTHTGLTSGTTYGYRVCTIDNAGNISTGVTKTAKSQ